MKIIGFSQLRNELSKGNLENYFRCMNTICDHIYIYDQASDDGSQDIYEQQDKAVIIQSDVNNFKDEILCKGVLLEQLLQDHEDVDWIFWMDGDTLVENRILENDGELWRDFVEKVSVYQMGPSMRADVVRFGHFNLWRSDIHYRVDNGYNYLNIGGVPALWRNNGSLYFPKVSGLHHPQYPTTLTNTVKADISLIHRGFATDYQIMLKYDIYKSRGQEGNDLERLLDESTLTVQTLPDTLLPSWFEITDRTDPREKDPVRDLYELQQQA